MITQRYKPPRHTSRPLELFLSNIVIGGCFGSLVAVLIVWLVNDTLVTVYSGIIGSLATLFGMAFGAYLFFVRRHESPQEVHPAHQG